MHKIFFQILLACFTLPGLPQQKEITDNGIFIKVDDPGRKVDVFFDGRYFTSYIYPSALEKPVLFPLTTSDGTIVTRGFPLQPRQGERVDHPHQTGWWFNYGEVNGFDFWNNSYAIPDSLKSHYGSIRHIRVVKAESGSDKARLVVLCQWVNPRNEVLLDEETTFEFSGDILRRRVVRTTKLTATCDTVHFGDNKEGLCALRVDRAFEAPAERPELFTDAYGNPMTIPVLDNAGVNGIYRNSEGVEKEGVWGKRARWISLSARKDNDDISIGMFDHPENPGFPAYWHARGYGLFSVNNLGKNCYDNSESRQRTVLKKGESIAFRHMLLIKRGGFMTHGDMEEEFKQFEDL